MADFNQELVDTQNSTPVTQQSTEETQINDDVKASNKKPTKLTGHDKVISDLSKQVAELCQKQPDQKVVNLATVDILTTLSAISKQQEFATSMYVNGEKCYFNEYKGTKVMNDLIAPARIAISTADTANDYLDRTKYQTTIGKVLSPEQFALALRDVKIRIHANPTLMTLAKDELMLLAEATKYFVVRGKVVDVNQNRLIYSTITLDGEAQTSIDRWIKAVALRLFE